MIAATMLAILPLLCRRHDAAADAIAASLFSLFADFRLRLRTDVYFRRHYYYCQLAAIHYYSMQLMRQRITLFHDHFHYPFAITCFHLFIFRLICRRFSLITPLRHYSPLVGAPLMSDISLIIFVIDYAILPSFCHATIAMPFHYFS